MRKMQELLAGTEKTEFGAKTLGVLCSFLSSLEAHIISVGKGHCQAVAKQQLKSCAGQKEAKCFVLYKLTF